MFYLKFRSYFAYLIDKYILKGALVRVANGYLDIERRPYIDLLIKLPSDVTEYDPTEIIQRFLNKFNHESEIWTYGGGYSPEPFDVFCDITPSVRLVRNNICAHGVVGCSGGASCKSDHK